MKLGTIVFGLAAIATGIIDIVWGGFESAHQPIQAFGDNVPGSKVFAYVVAVVLIAGGAGVLRKPTARLGAVALAAVYTIFAIFWMPRFFTAPQVLGAHPDVFIGVLGGVCQQLIVVGAALLVYAHASQPIPEPQRVTRAARWIFGVCSIDFGLTHLTGIAQATRFVPAWMPPNQQFWVVFTGIAFVLAGVAILIGVLDILAARLLALMLLVFSALALAPIIPAYPHDQVAWGANAYNLIAVASVWIYASWIAERNAQGVRS